MTLPHSLAVQHRRRPWRSLVWSLALLTLVGGCDGTPEPRGTGSLETLIDAPVRSADVDAWASARDATGKVERALDWSEGSGGACHGIACLILLPVVVAAALVPRIDTTSVVRRGAEVIFIGGYDTEGGLVFGRLLDGDLYKEVAVVERPALGARFVAVVATVPVASAGSDTGRVVVPLGSQVDLVARYRAALAAQTGDRTPLLTEMLTTREDEALVALAVRELAARRDDDELVAALTEVCVSNTHRPNDPLPTALVSAVGVSPGPLSTEAVMHVCSVYIQDEGVRDRFLRAAFDEWCAALAADAHGNAFTPFRGARGRMPYREHMVPVTQGCPPSIGRTRALFALRAPLPQPELRAAARAWPAEIVQHSTMHDANERAIAFEALTWDEARPWAIDVTTTIAHGSYPPLTSEEARALTTTYLMESSTSLAHDRKRIMTVLARRPRAELPARVRAQLDAAVTAGDAYARALALVLGDTRQALAVARSVSGPVDWSESSVTTADMVYAHALVLAGCTQPEASAAILNARSSGTPPACMR